MSAPTGISCLPTYSSPCLWWTQEGRLRDTPTSSGFSENDIWEAMTCILTVEETLFWTPYRCVPFVESKLFEKKNRWKEAKFQGHGTNVQKRNNLAGWEPKLRVFPRRNFFCRVLGPHRVLAPCCIRFNKEGRRLIGVSHDFNMTLKRSEVWGYLTQYHLFYVQPT